VTVKPSALVVVICSAVPAGSQRYLDGNSSPASVTTTVLNSDGSTTVTTYAP
jgi:hypothetical protein